MLSKRETVSRRDMLEARERRVLKQKILLDYGDCLVSFTMVIPGEIKVTDLITKCFKIGKNQIDEKLAQNNINVIKTETRYLATGLEGFWVLNANVKFVKKILIEIEESRDLGRLFDIDVIGSDFSSISRTQLGYPARKCLICEGMAHECSRSHRHTYPELIKKTYEVMRKYI